MAENKETKTEQVEEPAHVLVLGEQSFVCTDELSFGWILRHADDDLPVYLHHLLVKVIDPDELDDAWDALDDVSTEDALEAINALVESYAGERQGKPQRSASGSKRTKRK